MDVHFTLWPSLTQSEGGHAEITWEAFVAFVANPAIAADKKALEGWSPAKFTGNRRARAACELVSCIVLDDDSSGLPYERILELWGDVAGVFHSSHSSTFDAPKWRIVLRCSRDMTPDEHARVWAAVRDVARSRGQTVDEATKDPSRLWFVPAVKPGAMDYTYGTLAGDLLDVDAILAAVPKSATAAPSSDVTGTAQLSGAATRAPADRRHAMAAALGASWPAKGRHEAQLALAGALRAEGFTEAEAVEFLCAVCRAAGDEDRPKREATVRHTYGKPEGAALIGWTRLKSFVDPVVVDAARGALGQGAEFKERVTARLAEAAAATEHRPGDTPIAPAIVPTEAGPFKLKTGGFGAPLPPLTYTIDGLICKGDVAMIVAHGNSLKTWLAFSIALAIATGRPWLNQFAARQGKALLVDFESGDYEIVRRLKLLGARDSEVGDRLMRSAYSGANLGDFETWVALAGLGLELLVVDSFSAAAPDSDENDKRAAVMLQHAGTFANATGCTVIFIHHSRKDTGGDSRMNVRGSTALFAACDRIFECVDLESKDGGVILTTMRSIKDGAGRKPAPVRVELSDAGLRAVKEEPPKLDDEASTEEKNRALVFEILKRNPAGVPQKNLVDVMKGKREHKFAMLSGLALGGVLVEFNSEGKTWVMLNPKN